MALDAKTLAPKKLRGLTEILSPLGEVNGVQDYLLADRHGRILARKPDSLWKEEIAVAWARDVVQAAEIFASLSPADSDERVFHFRFEGAVLLVWDLGSAFLLALCSDEANLSIARMTANVVKEELKKDKQFRMYFDRPAGSHFTLLAKEAVGSELYKCVEALK